MTIVSAIQMTSTPELAHNLAQAAKLLAEAAEKGAQLAVLPEMFPQIGANQTEQKTIAETFGQGHVQDFLAEQAQKNQLWIVGGTIPLVTTNSDDSEQVVTAKRSREGSGSRRNNVQADITNERVRAACLVYDAQGVVRGRYDKIHLFDVTITKGQEVHRESERIEPGEEVIVVDTPFGRLGLAICYDLRFRNYFAPYLRKALKSSLFQRPLR